MALHLPFLLPHPGSPLHLLQVPHPTAQSQPSPPWANVLQWQCGPMLKGTPSSPLLWLVFCCKHASVWRSACKEVHGEAGLVVQQVDTNLGGLCPVSECLTVVVATPRALELTHSHSSPKGRDPTLSHRERSCQNQHSPPGLPCCPFPGFGYPSPAHLT